MRAFRVATPTSASGRTDDRGQYRLFGLPAGTYLVQAAARDLLTGTSGYVPQFHPGTPLIDLAAPTRLAADSTATAVDVMDARCAAPRVASRFRADSGVGNQGSELLLCPRPFASLNESGRKPVTELDQELDIQSGIDQPLFRQRPL